LAFLEISIVSSKRLSTIFGTILLDDLDRDLNFLSTDLLLRRVGVVDFLDLVIELDDSSGEATASFLDLLVNMTTLKIK
jgi:hypothetical protein